MKFTYTAVAALSTVASALQAPPGHAYRAPRKGDVRAPCPGLNSLANHGFINRNGKDIQVPQLITGGQAGLGISPDFMGPIGVIGLASPEKPDGIRFNLDDLAKHNFPIEHDASLSRQDFFFAQDDLNFHQPTYDSYIKHYRHRKRVGLKVLGKARYSRVNDSLTRNPEVVYGPRAFTFSMGETGLFTQSMGMSGLATSARVDYIRSLFEQQRLPYELGWTPPVIPVSLATLGAFNVALFNATGEEAPEGMAVTENTFREFILESALAIKTLLNVTGDFGV